MRESAGWALEVHAEAAAAALPASAARARLAHEPSGDQDHVAGLLGLLWLRLHVRR